MLNIKFFHGSHNQKINVTKNLPTAFALLFVCLFDTTLLAPTALGADASAEAANARLHQFLDKVYEKMDQEYYLPVSRNVYEDFLKNYPAERLSLMNQKTKESWDFVHLGAGLLVDKLKSPADRFTNFVPPKRSKAFKTEAYAVTEDLGIEGNKTKTGFEITKVQRHSQAYEKGVRKGDVLLGIDGRSVLGIDEAEIRKSLSPAVGTFTHLHIYFQALKKETDIILESISYFKETVSVLPCDVPGVLALKISHFNQKTHEDFSEEMTTFGISTIRHLVIDLRNNGGGPPLAAREIMGFFLPQNDPLFAIARKKQRPVMLSTPLQPVAYHGPITVLVNAKTGSAAELFGGLIQAKKLGVLVGQKTAGATYLKGIYDLEDGSLIFMITSLTFFYDKRVFPPDGLIPDTLLTEDQDSLQIALDKLREK